MSSALEAAFKMVDEVGKQTYELHNCRNTDSLWHLQDGDGTLDRFEVKKLCSMVEGKQMSEKELNEAMAALDSDSSGKVSFEEFKQYWEENISTGG